MYKLYTSETSESAALIPTHHDLNPRAMMTPTKIYQ